MVLATPEEALRPLPLRGKIALGYEIVRTYARVRRLQKGRDIQDVLDELRAEVSARQGDRTTLLNGFRLGRAVARTLGMLPSDTRCLIRSLVLTEMLSRRGIESALVIGVRTDDGFEAHAWVEHGGAPLLPDAEFGRLVELRGGGRPEPTT
jgi:hypothetical protein